ncbi:MAG TPA: anti-sigma factor [Aeromicrobium sp.]|nr:anti-sigma factor [Aeromicrobium sp.]
MSDIHALSGAYALDALNDLERAEFERHLGTCDSCRAEVAGLRDAASHLANVSAAPPPADLRAKVLAGAQSVRPLPPPAPEPARRRRIPALAAAAVLVIGLGAGAAVWQPWEPETVQVSLADRVRQAPDAQSWTQSLPSGGSVTVTRSKSVGVAVWQSTGLKPLPSGRVYELWLQAPDESLKPAGLFSAGDGEVVMRGDATEAIGAGVTEEPSGGSPAPTTEPIAFIDFRTKS